MNYNDEYELIWYAPMRTGTRALFSVFSKINFHCDTNNKGMFDHTLPNRMKENKKHYKTICSVRNPYSRLVSIYSLFRIHKNITNENIFPFDKFLKSIRSNYQIDYHKYFKNKFPDYLIHCENMSNDILLIPGVIENLKLIENEIETLLKNNGYKTNPNNAVDYWKNYYTEDLSSIVYNKLKNQFDMFGYDENSWIKE